MANKIEQRWTRDPVADKYIEVARMSGRKSAEPTIERLLAESVGRKRRDPVLEKFLEVQAMR